MLHRRNLIVRNFKIWNWFKEIFFWFFLNFECVFGFLLVFEQKHVLRHKCAVLLFTFFWSFFFWKYDSFVAKFLILTFQCIPDCDKLLINLTMSYCLKLWCSPKRKWCKCFVSKRYFPNVIFLISKVERRDWICERNNFVSKSMCKAFCSQKLRCRKDLKLIWD